MATVVQERLFGKAIKRREDPRFITGRGQYVDDVKLPGMLYAAFLRSPHAHARIKRIDTSKAKVLPGVKAVVTQADLAGKVGKLVDAVHGTSQDFQAFADTKVKYQGEKVGAVAAITR